MKVLRTKYFFDYRKYADKYGEEAAIQMQAFRSTIAGHVLEGRHIDKNSKRINKIGTAVGIPKEDQLKTDVAEKMLKEGKKGLRKLEDKHANTKKAIKSITKNTEKVKKIGKIGLGIAAGIGTALAANKLIKEAKEKERRKENENT